MTGVGRRATTLVALLLLLAMSLGMMGCSSLVGVQSGGNTQSGGGSLALQLASLNFGKVVVGASSVLSDSVTNPTSAPVTITAAAASDPEYTLSGLTLPLTLAAKQTVNFNVTFTPSGSGSPAATISITSNAKVPTATVSLAATAVPEGKLVATPASVNFGSVLVGSSQTLPETFTNTGGSDVTISQVTENRSDIKVSGPNLPLVLSPNQAATFSVTFTPTTSGSTSGTISVNGSASLTPDVRSQGVKFKMAAYTADDVSAPEAITIPVSGVATTPGQLAASPSSLDFGSVKTGSTQTKTIALTNSGGINVNLSQANASGAGFAVSGLSLPVVIAAGQSLNVNVTFNPQTSGSVSGNLQLVSDAADSALNVPLTGSASSAGTLALNPTSLDFGSVAVNSTQTLPATVTNSGGSSVTITQAAASGASFSLNGISLPLTLSAGQSKSFNVVFAPQSAGDLTGNITFTSDASNPTLTLPLAGTGLAEGALTSNPTSLSFGNIVVGGTQSLSETLTNSGGSSVTISQATISGSGFTISGLSLPLNLAAGQSTSFSVKFSPTAAGASSGNLVIVSNASNANLRIPLSGTGIAPGLLATNPSSVNFGTVTIGGNQSHSETLTNSGGTSIQISQATVSGSGFSLSGLSLPLTLTAGQSTTFTVTFTPAAAGASSGSIAIVSTASNPNVSIALTGTGATVGTVGANPSSINFGSVAVGGSSLKSETLTNTGGSTLTISQASATGSGFSVSGITLPLVLTAGQSFTFGINFAPPNSGSASGSVTITSNASNPTLTIGLTGSGTAQGTLAVNPTSLNLGSATVGSSTTGSASLNASGASVTVTSAASSSGEFSLSGISFPLTIAAGGSANFTVTFTPQASGTASGSLTFASNASNTPSVLSLSGTGNAPPQHSVDLSWNASTSAVSGYNVYRGTTQGGPYPTQVNSSLITGTTFTDTQVTAGATYYYVTKAVGTDDVESVNSNEAQAVIPTP